MIHQSNRSPQLCVFNSLITQQLTLHNLSATYFTTLLFNCLLLVVCRTVYSEYRLLFLKEKLDF